MHAVLFRIMGREVHLYGVLQYVSSVGGLALLGGWAWRWYRIAPASDAPSFNMPLGANRSTIIATMLLFAGVVGAACGAKYAARLQDPFRLREFLAAAFICGADAFLFALAAFCAHVHWRQRRSIPVESQPEV
jgi:hypothetical protein